MNAFDMAQPIDRVGSIDEFPLSTLTAPVSQAQLPLDFGIESVESQLRLLGEVEILFEDADQSLRNGDLGTYHESIQRARKLVAKVARDLGEQHERVATKTSGEIGGRLRRIRSRHAGASYWDRPKSPRNLYWFFGKLGISLISLGILLFLFVGYQLWGTGIEAAQSQNQLENTFENTVNPIVPSSEPGGSTNDPGPGRDPVVLEEGDPVAILEMPTLGVKKYVVAGVETADLKKGPGHYPSTPFPGELGNAAIAGHRTTYGEPFRQIDELAPGDPIIVTDLLGREFVYKVTEQRIVQPEDSWVVDTVDPTVATLTLTTCHPEFSARQRLIVFATLDTSESTPADTPAAVYSDNVGGASGLDDLGNTTTQPTSTVATTTQPGATTQPTSTVATTTQPGATTQPTSTVATTTQPGATTQPTSTVATTTQPGAGPDPANSGNQPDDDVFDKGWFSDSDAYPHVAGWILLEVLIVLGAWQVARRFRNRAIGAAVGVLPFLVTLYFVFQNVNRLLPPNL